jgi:hypothetical protein
MLRHVLLLNVYNRQDYFCVKSACLETRVARTLIPTLPSVSIAGVDVLLAITNENNTEYTKVNELLAGT